MAVKRMLTDWRGAPKWTKADRNRACTRASISPVWTISPFGLRPVEVLVAIQPGVHRVSGIPSGKPDSFNAELGTLVDNAGSWAKVAGERIVLWQSGEQSVTAIDLCDPKLVNVWAALIVHHFAWGRGYHLDYFSGLGWIAPNLGDDVWARWEQGWRDACAALREHHPGATLLGQQFHLTRITDSVDGLFLEESPGHFGRSFEQIAADMTAHGHASDWVLEIRDPSKFPSYYLGRCLAFAEAQGAFVSWGRDGTALVGMPE